MKYIDYKKKIKSYEDQGFTRKQAIKVIQDVEMAESHARNTSRSGQARYSTSHSNISINF